MLIAYFSLFSVTTCVVVWIEIHVCGSFKSPAKVTTCVVVWIEIPGSPGACPFQSVTTCVVVWIEISAKYVFNLSLRGHHLRGGVD